MNLLHPVWAEINLDNFIYNIKKIKSHIKSSEFIGVVKANAYGHGAVEISKTLVENGVNKLAVANVVEGIELRDHGINCPIMILGVSENYAIDSIIKYDMEPTISTLEFAKTLNNECSKINKIINIHIAIDTGMGRIGFLQNDTSLKEIIEISKMKYLKIISTFSHFSNADSQDKEYSYLQIKKYNYFIDELSKHNICIGNKSISNSAAIIDLPESHYDNVRPGIIQYGYYPSNEVKKDNLNVKPVLTWKSKIIHIKEVPENEYIGYGMHFKTSRKTTVATIPVGYADGYSRGLSNKGKVIINGMEAPIIGNVCMDQFMVDVTDIDSASIGSEVILLGSDNNITFNADNISDILGTINYEVLCLIGRRIPRVYIKDGAIKGVQYLM